MGQDRFKAEKIIMQRSQVNGCPVVPVKTTIYKDTVNGKKVFTNEFRSNYEGTVDEISVKITCFNDNAEVIGIIKDYKYGNLNVKFGEEFGNKKYIACPDDTIASFTILITYVTMENGYYWSEVNGKIKNINDVEEEIPVEVAFPVEEPVAEDAVLPEEEDVDFSDGMTSKDDSVKEEEAAETKVETTAETTDEVTAVQPETAPQPETASESTTTQESTTTPESSSVQPNVAAQPESVPENTTVQSESAPQQAGEVDNTDSKGKKKKEKKEKKPLPKWLKFIRTLIIVGVLLVAAYFALTQWNKYSDYNRGTAFMAEGNYEYAVTVFERLGNYQNSPQLLVQARESFADSLLANGTYDRAVEAYKSLGGHEQQIQTAYEQWIASLVEGEETDAAYELLTSCQVEIDDELQSQVFYGKGNSLFEDSAYEEAMEFYLKAGNYEDSKEMIIECYYQMAVVALDAGDYDAAVEYFDEVSDYKDAREQIILAKYSQAQSAIASRDFEGALEMLEDIAEYEDSAALLQECYYAMGQSTYLSGDYENAMNYYEAAGEYEDSSDRYIDALYKYLLMAMEKEVTAETVELLEQLPKDYEDVNDIMKLINKFVDHVGSYQWSASNDREINALGGIEDYVVVTLTYSNGEVDFRVDGYPVDQRLFVYDSGTNSDTYTMLNTTTITRTLNGKVHTYKKIVE